MAEFSGDQSLQIRSTVLQARADISSGTLIANCRSRRLTMKKITAFLMAAAILMAMAIPGFAQGRDRRCDSRSRGTTYQTYYDNSSAYYGYDQQYRGRNIWDRHRDKLSVAAGALGGAAIGGLVGGRRGAAIGALAGLGGSALYTYKLRNRRYRY
jgi:hypothetical protein